MSKDYQKIKDQCVKWIRDFFEENGKGCNAIVGISGGKDSSVVAALCVEALGKERVIGILMPNGVQADIDASRILLKHLDICNITIDIGDSFNSLTDNLEMHLPVAVSEQTMINLPARLRMAVLYAVAQSMNGRVANTSNLSEETVGYSTRYGDSVGDFSPLLNLTVTDVKAIGRELGLPDQLVDKVPSDGLCGITDEEKLGFTYDQLDCWIRTGYTDDEKIDAEIEHLERKNRFKRYLMPAFYPRW